MRLQRHIKLQLGVFLAIAVSATSILAVGFGRLPELLFGAGHYRVTVDLNQSGGLYRRANVTYRGTPVGRVDDVTLTPNGVQAILSLDNGTDVPANVTAEVHSQSVIGEQFVALVPRADAGTRALRGGDRITVERTSTPPDIGTLLDTTHTALAAIPGDNLTSLIDESYTALGGLSAEFTRIVDGSTTLAIDAKNTLPELTNAIDNFKPLLDTQTQTADAVSAWASHMSTITGQLQQHNEAVSSLLRNTAPSAEQTQALFDRVKPTLPVLMANLVNATHVGIVFAPNLEQLLVLVPQGVQILGGVGIANYATKQPFRGAYQQLATNLNVPPPCNTGYLPATQRRATALEDYPGRTPGDFYCRIPQDSPWNVRGARNIPCETKPWKRAPTVWMCESDEDYVPLNDGNNWKGDPNATYTGQDVPQLAPGTQLSPDGLPPATAPPTALAIADYNPADGSYIGPDGLRYIQANLGTNGGPKTWQDMLTTTVGKP
ncbi:MlaD family protein [Mycobacterium sp. DL99]|uniref:MCE family protein n=1 Tax=Mycobacterium sp. DL99 TaxID=2528957 RepID=UPI001081B260|nr:MlaD family protein [Mycobacterium sp. DL99]